MSATNSHQRSYQPAQPWQLWSTLVAGPLIWSVHLVASYALVSVACQWGFLQSELLGITGLRLVLLVFTAIAALVVLYTGYLAYGNWRDIHDNQRNDEKLENDRYHFMVYSAVILNGLFFAILLVSLAPVVFLNLCG